MLRISLCPCAQSMGTRTKFQFEILIKSTILVIYKIQENILESSRIVSETLPRETRDTTLSAIDGESTSTSTSRCFYFTEIHHQI